MSIFLESSKGGQQKRFLLPLGVFVAILLALGFLSKLSEKPKLGLLEVQGVILDSKITLSQIAFLSKEEKIKGVLVRVNSPGGAVAPSQEIYEALKKLAKLKPVYVSMGSIAASGGFYISLAGSKVYANPGTLTGSIGVILEAPNASVLLDKLGLSVQVVKSGKNKDIGSAYRAMKPEERKLLQSVIMDTYEQFIQAILDSRNIKEADLRAIADGRIFTGRQAQQLGLLDQLGGYNDVLAQLKTDLHLKGEVEVVAAPKPELGFIASLQNEAASKITSLFSPVQGLMYLSPLLTSH